MVDLELAAQDVAGIQVVDALGIKRVELCSALALGGLTPSMGLIEQAMNYSPEVHLLVRPRAGGFEFDRDETRVMVADIHRAVGAGVHGVAGVHFSAKMAVPGAASRGT